MKSRDQTLHIVGVSACTSLGDDVLWSAAAASAGARRISEHPFIVSTTAQPYVCGRAAYLDADLVASDRILALAELALSGLSSTLANTALVQIPCTIGLPNDRPGLATDIAKQTSGLKEVFSALRIKTIRHGHASALYALPELVSESHGGIFVVGGADSYMDWHTLRWLENGGYLSTKEGISGFVPGEGAAFVVFATSEAAQRYQLAPLATLQGFGRAIEPVDKSGGRSKNGHGLTSAFRSALGGARPSQLEEPASPRIGVSLGRLWSDANGEQWRSDDLLMTMPTIAPALSDPGNIHFTAQIFGDVGAATAPLSLAIASVDQEAHAASTISASSETGERLVVVISQSVSATL